MSDDKPKHPRTAALQRLNGDHANRDEHGHFLPGHKLGGAPTKLTDDVIDEITELLARGMSLEEACNSSPDFPSAATVYQWASGANREDEETSARLRQKWDLARERFADALAFDYVRTVKKAPHDKDEAAWLRELGAAVRWKTAMLAPSRYGRRVGDAGDIALNVGVQVVLPGKDDDK